MKSHITKLINRRVYEPVKVYERDGSVFITLEPGITYEAESVNPAETLYARWSEVRWEPHGKISLVARTDFREPDKGRWTLHMLNQDGEPAQFRQVGEERVCLPKGIPVRVTCPLTDPLVMFQSLTITRTRIQVKSDTWVGYLAHRWVLRDEKVPRPDSELKALAKILDDLGKK